MSTDYRRIEDKCIDKKFWAIFAELVEEFRKYQDPDGHQTDAELLGDMISTILFHHTEGFLFDDHKALGEFIGSAQQAIESWQSYYPSGYSYTEYLVKRFQIRGMVNMSILGEELNPITDAHGRVIYTRWPVRKPGDPRLLEWMKQSYEQHHEVRLRP